MSREDPHRFFDTRAAYTMFVTATDEKQVVADRLGEEIEHLDVSLPGLRVFDAGMGDASVLTHMMRRIHRSLPHIPWLIVAKEISIEDVRQALLKLPDRLLEHPEVVFVVTNMRFTEAPTLAPENASDVRWTEVALTGTTSHEFSEQIRALFDGLARDWDVTTSRRSGNPVYLHPAAVVIYRRDREFLLRPLIPRPGGFDGSYDLIVASQAYRAKTPVERKVRSVIMPLIRRLAPGGCFVGVQAHGHDPGEEIITGVWPIEHPFPYSRDEVVAEIRRQLIEPGDESLEADALEDERSIFRYSMHTMPSQEVEHIGTSTLVAAFTSACYVAQIDEPRLTSAMASGAYLDATRAVIEHHGGVWFNDETFLVRRDALL